MREAPAQRPVGGVLLAAGVLGLIGNALHPVIRPDMPVEEFLGTVDTTLIWGLVHLTLVVSFVFLIVGVVLLARWLSAIGAATFATTAAVLAVVGGTVAVVQIGALDLFLMNHLAAEYVAGNDTESVLAIAQALWQFDLGLVALWVALFLGATVLSVGLAMQRVRVFAAWIRWAAIIAGAVGTVLGGLMLIEVAVEFTVAYGLRAVGLVDTVVVIAIGLQLYGAKVAVPEGTP